MNKYEQFTGEVLGYKPRVAELVKLKYSPLGKVFNKGIGKNHEKEGQNDFWRD